MVADTSGTFLFVSDFQKGCVDAFTIDSQSGTLSAVAGSPFTAGAFGRKEPARDKQVA